MSRQNVVKANTTRLPPKTTSIKKQPTNRLSNKAKKAIMEKENQLREELSSTLKDQSECLVGILEAGGVPKMLCNEITKSLSLNGPLDDTVERIDNATNAVMQSFSYGECYPAIDILRFITVLDQIQSGVVELARLSHKPVERKLREIQADSKVDPSILATTEEIESQMKNLVTRCSIVSYKTRALQHVITLPTSS